MFLGFLNLPLAPPDFRGRPPRVRADDLLRPALQIDIFLELAIGAGIGARRDIDRFCPAKIGATAGEIAGAIRNN
jgi:hypothetical protein